MDLSQFGVLGASAMFGVAVFRLFKFFDGFFPNEIKQNLARVLKRELTSQWTETVILMNDRVYIGSEPEGRIHPRVWRVICVSFVTSVFLSIIFFLLASEYREFFAFLGIPTLLLLFLLLNPAVDYVSVLETRIVLQWMNRGGRFARIASLAILDIVLTVLLILFVFPLGAIAFNVFMGEDPDFTLWVDFVRITAYAIFLHEDGFPLSVYVYTTFLTTIWTWFFVLSETVIRLSSGFQRIFPVETKPFSSIGVVAGFFAGVSLLIVGMVRNFV